jgi:hypothetical protein
LIWCNRGEERSAMSHIWARRLAYVLGVILLAGVALFAWAQSG